MGSVIKNLTGTLTGSTEKKKAGAVKEGNKRIKYCPWKEESEESGRARTSLREHQDNYDA